VVNSSAPELVIVVVVAVGRTICGRRGDAEMSMSDSSGLAYGASPGLPGRRRRRAPADGGRRRRRGGPVTV